jgi:hypothetical protein
MPSSTSQARRVSREEPIEPRLQVLENPGPGAARGLYLPLQMAANTSQARRVSRIFRGGARPPEDDLVPGTAAERLQMMWPLTLDAWAFRGESIEPRLQRHTVRIVRGRR